MANHLMCGSLRCACVAALATALLLGAFPLRAGAESDPSDPLAGNAALEQRVRIHSEGIAVGELMALISKETGVDVTVLSDVADDKVIVFGPPRLLKEVLADLAALFNDTWVHTRTSGGKDRYALSRSITAQDYEDKLAREIQDRLMRQLDAYIAAAKSPEPYTYEGYRVAAQFLGLLTVEQKQQLLMRRSLNLPFDSLTPAEQSIARQGVASLYDADAAVARKNGQEYKRPPDADLERDGLRFQIQNAGADPAESHLHLFLIVGAAYSEDFGKLDDRIPWLLPVRGNPYTRRSIPDSATVPDASQMLPMIDGPSLSWPKRLEALSEKTGAPILADYYRCQPPPLPTVDPFPAEKGDPGRLALDQWGKTHSVLWWVRGDTLLVRRRDWYTQRLSEVPDRWVLELQKHLTAQKGIPTYGDVLSLTHLTQAQMAGLRVSESVNRFSGILGDGTDETSLAGLPELLAIYRSRYAADSRTPLPSMPRHRKACVALHSITRIFRTRTAIW
jgi:hypothetical protein